MAYSTVIVYPVVVLSTDYSFTTWDIALVRSSDLGLDLVRLTYVEEFRPARHRVRSSVNLNTFVGLSAGSFDITLSNLNRILKPQINFEESLPLL